MSCPDCFKGYIWSGTPTGKVTTINGIPTYVAQPEEGVKPKGLVVVITDAFGMDFVNNRLICDEYAKKGGFVVYCPDFMDGKPLSLQAMVLMDKIIKPGSWFTAIFQKPIYVVQAIIVAAPWLYRCRLSVCKPRISKYFQDLRTSAPPFETNNLRIGAAGFCWGGKYTFLLAHDDPSTRVQRHSSQVNSANKEPLLDCGFTAHPSNLVVPADIEPVVTPISVAVGDKDMAMKGDMLPQIKEILEVKKKGDHEVVIIPGAKHGFGIRTEPNDEFQVACSKQAQEQAIAWFTRWFA